jgi:hypothetical protein
MADAAPSPTAPVAQERSVGRSWALALLLASASFLVLFDSLAVATALPAIGDEFGLRPGVLQWVVSLYSLTIGAFLVLGGRVCDVWGRRRVMMVGLAVCTGAGLLGRARARIFPCCSPAGRCKALPPRLLCFTPVGSRQFETRPISRGPGRSVARPGNGLDKARRKHPRYPVRPVPSFRWCDLPCERRGEAALLPQVSVSPALTLPNVQLAATCVRKLPYG